MKKLLFLTSIGIVLIAGCKPQEAIQQLPADEVLQKAAEVNRALQSATFDVSAEYVSSAEEQPAVESALNIDGILQSAGRQFHLIVAGNMQWDDENGQEQRLSGNAEAMIVGPGELYFHIHSLITEPDNAVFSPEILSSLLDQWWQLPENSEQQPAITPDPNLLRAQIEVVQVTTDHGIEMLDGQPAYHYSVTLDPDKLRSFLVQSAKEEGEEVDPEELDALSSLRRADGEVWIDASTFYLRALEWQIEQSSLSLSFTMNIADHNQAAPISPPQDAKPFSPLSLLMQSDSLPFLGESLPLSPP